MHEAVLDQHGLTIYISLFTMLLGGAAGLPVPEDVPLVLGGILAQRGSGSLQMIFLVCYVGILLGDVFIYGIGRFFGKALLEKPWFKKRIQHRRLKQVQQSLEKRSLLMICIARHLFYLRTVTFLTCGVVHMRFARFLIADALAALVSAPLMMSVGYLASQHYDAAMAFLAKAKWVSFLIFLLVGAAAFAYWRTRARPQPLQED